jgi:hypothetical protein
MVLHVISAYFAAVNPEGPAPMIATESTLSRLLLGIEPMFLVEIYPLRRTKSTPLASRESLLNVRYIVSIDDSASGINQVTWIVYGAITPSNAVSGNLPTTCCLDVMFCEV